MNAAARSIALSPAPAMTQPVLDAEITCPECGHRKAERMSVDACLWFYRCEACGALLRPKPGDCCVFCSYANVPCPPKQR